ncbi:hypothetical protein N9N08_00340 [bacterium]|jgi:hypothetical protein|nr:hypothetical protein [bacterium]
MPINRRSINMLSATSTDMNKYSTQVKGDSFYGYSDGYHTFQVTYNQFVGRIRIQATLSLTPGDDDWFDLVANTSTYGSVTDQAVAYNPLGYVQFNANDPAQGSQAYTVQGNFTYVRVYMDRTHIGDGETYDSSYGQISRVILSA